MILSWLLPIAANYLVKAALVRYGLTAAQAALATPRVLASIKDLAAVVKYLTSLKGGNKTDEEAVKEAERVVLDPRSPDYQVTYKDITSSGFNT